MSSSNSSTIAGIEYILSKSGQITVSSVGVSMYPFIQEGDTCQFVPLKERDELSKGDIILFINDQEKLVGHRLQQCYVEGQIRYYIFKGDTNFKPDYPVREDQLIARLSMIKKKNICISANGFLAKWWGAIALNFPKIPRYCKTYLNYKNRLYSLFRERE